MGRATGNFARYSELSRDLVQATCVVLRIVLHVVYRLYRHSEAFKPPAVCDRRRCNALAAACKRSEESREGQRAFAERRSPEFRGR